MKNLFSTFILLCLFCNISKAQNSVKVKQNGNGNSVSINQSNRSDETNRLGIPSNCADADTMSRNKNIIRVKSRNNGKTIIQSTAQKKNTFYSNQNGTKSQSSVTILGIPDTIAARQQGAKNGIDLYVNDSDSLSHTTANAIQLNQQGTKNAITIGPCNEKSSANGTNSNNIKVDQKGKGNTATISVHK